MKKLLGEEEKSNAIQKLKDEYIANNQITKEQYNKYGVKRGLRNEDGTGVMAGLTRVCRVHGYLVEDGEKIPDKGRLIYRGIDIDDIVTGCMKSDRYSFEETIWLLIFGNLPNQKQYDTLNEILYKNRELPDFFPEDVIMKNPSKDIMNKLARSVLTLYSYDDNADDLSIENNIRQSLSLIARLPTIMTYSYQVKRRYYDKEAMTFHPLNPSHSTAEAILNSIRDDGFTKEEARLLDMCLTLHAEHGGGNNSTFTTRVLTSSDTDIYSTIAGGIGSLKGFKHGGANRKVDEMMADIMENVKDWSNDEEIASYLEKIVRKQVGDKSGLIYGMGHAIYTISDPRAIILKEHAKKLAVEKGYAQRFDLYERIEKLSPEVFAKVKDNGKVICANVDFYSGMVYEMLGIPHDLFTPLFAVARIAGWCAHRLEEMTNGGRIIRPAYRALPAKLKYIEMEQR
ncbi:MAG: citrate synthase [Clostridia bacterium]